MSSLPSNLEAPDRVPGSGPGAEGTMAEIMDAYPGAQRVLFRRYHIGGCSSCAFRPDETLAALCERNQGLRVDEVLDQIRNAHAEDAKILIEPGELKRWMDAGAPLKLLDIRSRPEFEAVRLTGATLMTQESTQDIMAHWPPEQPLVIIDHKGKQGLDAAAFYLGHGLKNVRCLRGGIDAWSQEIDSTVRRYDLG